MFMRAEFEIIDAPVSTIEFYGRRLYYILRCIVDDYTVHTMRDLKILNRFCVRECFALILKWLIETLTGLFHFQDDDYHSWGERGRFYEWDGFDLFRKWGSLFHTHVRELRGS